MPLLFKLCLRPTPLGLWAVKAVMLIAFARFPALFPSDIISHIGSSLLLGYGNGFCEWRLARPLVEYEWYMNVGYDTYI